MALSGGALSGGKGSREAKSKERVHEALRGGCPAGRTGQRRGGAGRGRCGRCRGVGAPPRGRGADEAGTGRGWCGKCCGVGASPGGGGSSEEGAGGAGARGSMWVVLWKGNPLGGRSGGRTGLEGGAWERERKGWAEKRSRPEAAPSHVFLQQLFPQLLRGLRVEVGGGHVQHGEAAGAALLVQAVHRPGIGGQHAGGELRVGVQG